MIQIAPTPTIFYELEEPECNYDTGLWSVKAQKNYAHIPQYLAIECVVVRADEPCDIWFRTKQEAYVSSYMYYIGHSETYPYISDWIEFTAANVKAKKLSSSQVMEFE